MPWIPLSKAAIKYDIHPLTLLSWIEKDDICGATIGNNWFIDEATLQEFIREQFSMPHPTVNPCTVIYKT